MKRCGNFSDFLIPFIKRRIFALNVFFYSTTFKRLFIGFMEKLKMRKNFY